MRVAGGASHAEAGSEDRAEQRILGLLAAEADPAYRRRAAWAVSRLRPSPGQRILDVGAAEATMLRLAAALAPVETVALDVDLSRLLLARACGYRGAAVVADARRLPFAAGTFDGILACELLEHVDDDVAVLEELREALGPAGRLVVTVPHADYPTAWDPVARLRERLGLEPLRCGWYVGIWYGHLRLYREEELERRLTLAGWSIRSRSRLVRRAFPFAHFLLYGIGRRLLAGGLIRGETAARLGRRSLGAPPLRPWRPLGLALLLLRWTSSRSHRRQAPPARAVHLALVAGPGRSGGRMACGSSSASPTISPTAPGSRSMPSGSP